MSSLEINIDKILAPYRNQGALSKNLDDQTRQALSKEITQLLCAHFHEIAPKHNVQKYWRKWLTWCHPDKGDITTDFKFEEELVLSAKCANEINSLSQINNGAASSNTAVFFTLLNKAYETYTNPKNNETQEVHDELSFSAWFSQFMANPQFYTVVGQNLKLRSWSHLTYAPVGPDQYFVGSIGEWIQSNLRNKLVLVLHHASDKKLTSDALRYLLQNSEYSPLFAELRDPSAPHIPFVDGIFDSLSQPDSARAATPMTVLSPDAAIIQYHLLVAQEELNKPCRQQGHKVEIEIRGWANHEGHPLTRVTYGKLRYYEAQLYLSLWHILYADPTAQDNFHNLARAEITTLASRSQTEKQYAALRTLFSDPSNELITSLNQKVYPRGNWNWLLEATDWMYTHGHDAAIARPWILRQHGNTLQEENYLDAKSEKRISRVVSNVKKAIQNFGLTKLLGNPEYALFLPSLLLAVVFPWLFPSMALTDSIVIGLFLPIASLLVMKGASFCHAVLESTLQTLAQTNKPFSLSVPQSVPNVLKEYYGQVVAPLGRILSQPYDDSYSAKAKQYLRFSYLPRVFLGFTLSLLTSVSFIADQLTLHLNQILGVAMIGFFNVPFAVPEIFKLSRSPKPSPSASSSPAKESGSKPMPDFDLSKRPILMIEGPQAKTAPRAQGPALPGPGPGPEQKEQASLKPM